MKIKESQLQILSDYDFSLLCSLVSKERGRRNKLKKIEVINESSDKNAEITNLKAFAINSTELRSLKEHGQALCHRSKYFKALICQDWRHLYPRESDYGNCYVYAHIDPRKEKFEQGKHFGGSLAGTPFYIGKGTGNRAYDLKRNEGHGRMLRELLSKDYKPEHIVKIMFDGLSDQKALEIESKLIYFFGTVYTKGRSKGFLVNLDIPKIPEFIGEMVSAKKHITDIDLVVNGYMDLGD